MGGGKYEVGTEGGEETHSHNYGVEYGLYFGMISGNNGYAITTVDYSLDGSSKVLPGESVVQRNFAVNASMQTSTRNYDCNTYRTNTKTSYTSNYPPYFVVYMWERIE